VFYAGNLKGNGTAAIYNAAVVEMRAGRYLEAQIRSGQALEKSPEDPEVLHLTALAARASAHAP
jgi:hypothetical protein